MHKRALAARAAPVAVVVAVLGASMLLPIQSRYASRSVACSGYLGAPAVTSVSPLSGPAGGGTTVTILGCGFASATAVNFISIYGSTAVTPTTVSDTEIIATIPSQPAASDHITVTSGAGTSTETAADLFTYFGMYTMDGWGGMHGHDSLSSLSSPSYWLGWSIARAAHVWPGATADQEGFILDGWGGLHPFSVSGAAPNERAGDVLAHQWQGIDIARDFAFTPDGTGGLVLDGFGGLHGFGLDGNKAPTVQAAAYWPGWDIARKVVIGADGKGGYVLDGFGGLHPFGINSSPPPTLSSIASTSYWPGWAIARDVALIPGNGGYSGYVLDGFGGLHPFHPATDLSSMPAAIASSYPGFDIIRSLWLLPGSTTDGYTLDGWGGLHPFGDAPAIASNAYWPGWDIARVILGSNPASALPGSRNPITWPFASNSIWNMPIGSGAVYLPASIAPATIRTVVTDQDVVVMTPGSPLTPIQSNNAGWSGGDRCATGGSTLDTVPIPSNFTVPSSRNNNAYAILQPDGQSVAQGQPFARCTAGDPATTSFTVLPANLYTDGIRGAHGGSGLSSLGGTIRLGELVPGASPIRHALKIELDGANLYQTTSTSCYRWPAVRCDLYGPTGYGGTNPALKMGALLALPPTFNCASLTSEPGRKLCWTFLNYGAYVVDDAARSVYSIATENGPDGPVTDEFQSVWGFPFVTGLNDTAWARDIATIFANLAVIDNNLSMSIGGGGAPLQPYAPVLG